MYIKKNLLIIILQFTATQMYTHHKPLAEKIWSERCMKNSIVLNDCNWCRCDSKQKYDCKARVCEEIDMFGHFKDAIQEIDVGMEGRGSWRSKPTFCSPGVHYRRGAVLCVCDEDGNWPNPVCRDLFQILHSVEAAGQTRLSTNESCTPTKLYIVGCNVCMCPSSGYLDPHLCTKKECQEDDPIIEADNSKQLRKVPPKVKEEALEIYAICDPKYKYELGCRTCDCVRNNRLLCDNCTISDDKYSNDVRQTIIKNTRSICKRKGPFQAFKIDCNLCHCSRKSTLFCTVKKCLDPRMLRLKSSFKMSLNPKNYKKVSEPPDDQSCIPGTKFKRDCNTCVCDILKNGVKYVDCSRAVCSKNLNSVLKNDCVENTFYEDNCMLCHCYVKKNVKYQICRLKDKCIRDIEFSKNKLNGKPLKDVGSLPGYCEPMQKYKKGCNTCRCLADGKTVECTSMICAQKSDALEVDIVPVVMENGERCPKGHSYKLDCNLCFCLSNGNAICTTAICSNQNNYE